MSFLKSATEVLERAEASLHSLMNDALNVKAYGDIAVIAEMAESVQAISRPTRADDGLTREDASTSRPFRVN